MLQHLPHASIVAHAIGPRGRTDHAVGGADIYVETDGMLPEPLLRRVDAVTVPVPDIDEGLRFYRDALGHQLLWRNDDVGQAGLRLPDSDTELVLSEHQVYEPAWLVSSAIDAADVIVQAGGQVVEGPLEIPVGAVVVVRDSFGNRLVLLDLSKGTYRTDAEGNVTGVTRPPSRRRG
jgi:predicted enzyme related to lactoylglutathione lyase